ncbi:GNAT family N-acetyltransferase [Arthrobacter sp. ISL-48]|uniref:GNAT family N-acetyltransferase n=1 Tax=Arthrobacter sp. ISL-48 TaxID=2819110 RepID=UPI001BE8CDC2|nr:GNAT family N-acetyltransferase [Arthrobacter sp. ISL-48]MBT2533033.1 GNAT family N-acetyltransferase [Arthrobacter sp. ISL-48]
MPNIREGTAQDTPGLARLRAKWAAEQDPALTEDPDFERTYLQWAQTNPRKHFVAELDGKLIGMLNLMIFERMPKPGKASTHWVYVGNVYVLPAFRNAGLGGELMQASIRFSEAIGAARMVLSPSVQARSFYKRLGFEPAQELNVLHLQG